MTSIYQKDRDKAEDFWDDCGEELLGRLSLAQILRTRSPAFVSANVRIITNGANSASNGLRIPQKTSRREKEYLVP